MGAMRDTLSPVATLPVEALLAGASRALSGYLLNVLRTGACARLGPGARPVALTAAAHDPSCGSLMACAGRALLSRERLKRGLLSSK